MVHDIVEQDARWLSQAGEQRRVAAGEEIVRAGVRPERLFVVLEGALELSPPAADGASPRRLGPGELVGETEQLRQPNPEGPVHAATDGVLLCLRPADVDARIREDPSFHERFLTMLKDIALDQASGGAEGMPQMIERLLEGI